LGVVRSDSSTEYIDMGTYYLTEWRSDEGALTASFTARDILDILAQNEFAGDTYTTETLYDIADELLTAVGITDYTIDTALQGITVSGTIAKMNYRDAINLVAMAGMSVVYSDRYGSVQIKQLSNVAESEIIDYDNVYSSPQIKLDKLINTIIIDLGGSDYTYVDPAKPADEETFSVKITNGLITDAGIAEDVAIWLLAEYKKRYLYEVNWRMNPSLEAGDIVTVEDDFGEDKTMRITKQEFSFQGYLGGKTSGKGGGT
jgi:hypothetical protein